MTHGIQRRGHANVFGDRTAGDGQRVDSVQFLTFSALGRDISAVKWGVVAITTFGDHP